jgi:hypothetical protein
MFTLSKSNTYSWPVVVEFPVSGGKFHKETFDAEFVRLSQTEIAEIGQSADDKTAIKRVMVGWKGVTDDGEELPFSEDALDRMLDIPLVAMSILAAYRDSVLGIKAKN